MSVCPFSVQTLKAQYKTILLLVKVHVRTGTAATNNTEQIVITKHHRWCCLCVCVCVVSVRVVTSDWGGEVKWNEVVVELKNTYTKMTIKMKMNRWVPFNGMEWKGKVRERMLLRNCVSISTIVHHSRYLLYAQYTSI